MLEGAQGVGLFRTEYLFLDRKTLPNEEEQCAAINEWRPSRLTGNFRTLDIGADKISHAIGETMK